MSFTNGEMEYKKMLKALGKMCNLRALPRINDALQDGSPLIRKEAQNALLELRQCSDAYSLLV